jgi:hypothetical protein
MTQFDPRWAERTDAGNGKVTTITADLAIEKLLPYYKDEKLTREAFLSGIPMRTPWATYQLAKADAPYKS